MSETAICGWCRASAVTEVITRPGRKNRQTAPVCEAHASDFEQRGIPTLRTEEVAKSERERKHGEWLKRTMPWL